MEKETGHEKEASTVKHPEIFECSKNKQFRVKHLFSEGLVDAEYTVSCPFIVVYY